MKRQLFDYTYYVPYDPMIQPPVGDYSLVVLARGNEQNNSSTDRSTDRLLLSYKRPLFRNKTDSASILKKIGEVSYLLHAHTITITDNTKGTMRSDFTAQHSFSFNKKENIDIMFTGQVEWNLKEPSTESVESASEGARLLEGVIRNIISTNPYNTKNPTRYAEIDLLGGGGVLVKISKIIEKDVIVGQKVSFDSNDIFVRTTIKDIEGGESVETVSEDQDAVLKGKIVGIVFNDDSTPKYAIIVDYMSGRTYVVKYSDIIEKNAKTGDTVSFSRFLNTSPFEEDEIAAPPPPLMITNPEKCIINMGEVDTISAVSVLVNGKKINHGNNIATLKNDGDYRVKGVIEYYKF